MHWTDAVKTIGRPCGLWLGSFHHYQPRPFPKMSQRSFKRKSFFSPLKISIVTPSYMQCNFIEATIQSVLNQDYDNLEYIVVDGNSTDGTGKIIEKYRSHLTGCISEPDSGQANAINKGFKQSTGEIMGWLNSDDRLTLGTLHAVNHYFQKHPNIDVLYGHRIIINESNQDVGRWIVPKHVKGCSLWADYIPQETMFWRRRIWDAVDSHIDETLNFAIDWDLICRFEKAGARFARLNRYMGIFTTHNDQKSIADKEQLGREEFSILREKYMPTLHSSAYHRLLNYTHILKSIGLVWKYKLGF